MTADSGADAIFLTFEGIVRPTATAGVLAIEGSYAIRGGRGRFAGATGSGKQSGTAEFAKDLWTASFDGTISAPR